MFRQVFMVFTGPCRAAGETRRHIHESPGAMTAPLVVLALLAAIGGWVGIPFLEGGSPLHRFLSPVFMHPAATPAAAHGAHDVLAFVVMGISVLAGLMGIGLAAVMYYEPLKQRAGTRLRPAAVAARFPRVHRLLEHKYHVDEFYDAAIVRPLMRACRYCLAFDLAIIDGLVNGAGWLTRLAAWLAHKADIYLVDGIVNSLATLVGFNSGWWRRLQTGYLQNYALILLAGLVLMVGRVLAWY
jgi:NADH-quinone oxidoreductase subunit L